MVKYRNFLLNSIREEINAQEMDNRSLLVNSMSGIRTQRMRDIGEMLKDLEVTFRQTGTFKTNEFVEFLTKFFTLTEGGKARGLKLDLEPFENEKVPSYYVVGNEETVDFITDIVKTERDVKRFLKPNDYDDVIRIKGEVVYPFKENLTMKDKYGDHYRLKYAIYELMQLKVDHPDITDKERYEIVLANTVRRNLIKSEQEKKNR